MIRLKALALTFVAGIAIVVAGQLHAVVAFGVDLEVLRADLLKVQPGNVGQIHVFIQKLEKNKHSHEDFEGGILKELSDVKWAYKKNPFNQSIKQIFDIFAKVAKNLDLSSDLCFGVDLNRLYRDLLVIPDTDASTVITIEGIRKQKMIDEQGFKKKLDDLCHRIEQDAKNNPSNNELKATLNILQKAQRDFLLEEELQEVLQKIEPELRQLGKESIGNVQIGEVDVSDVLKALQDKPPLLSRPVKYAFLVSSALLLAGSIYKAIRYSGPSSGIDSNIAIMDTLINAANNNDIASACHEYEKSAKKLTLVTREEKALLLQKLNSARVEDFYDCAQTICARLEQLKRGSFMQKIKAGLLHDYRTIKNYVS